MKLDDMREALAKADEYGIEEIAYAGEESEALLQGRVALGLKGEVTHHVDGVVIVVLRREQVRRWLQRIDFLEKHREAKA